MTDERKPETPGMSEVSPKFVDEVEAAAEALPPSANISSDPLIALGEQWQEAYNNWQAKLPTAGSDEEWTAQDDERSLELGKIAWGLEDQATEIPAQSLDGVLVKLRMAGTHYHLIERDGEEWDNKYAQLTWQAWDGLERLIGTKPPRTPSLRCWPPITTPRTSPVMRQPMPARRWSIWLRSQTVRQFK